MPRTPCRLAGLLCLLALPGPAAEADEAAARNAFRAAVRKFQDPAVSRPALLAEFQAITRRFPANPFPGHLRRFVVQLKIMVAEDRAHAAHAPARPPAWWTREERIAELIYQLRDQNGRGED